MSYYVEIISPMEKDSLVDTFSKTFLYERKAEIHGACIKLLTNVKQFYEMWIENFKPISEEIRPHGRLFVINSGKGASLRVKYEPISKTLIILDCDYYGLVKSLALSLTSDFFEEYHSEHRRYSVHGSLVDRQGRGLVIMGPPGSGKTTLTYGLLTNNIYNYVADDWFFVRIMGHDLIGYGSEKNSYIREDLASNWPIFKKKLEDLVIDSKGRAVANVHLLFGEHRIRESTHIRAVVLLQRDKGNPKVFSEIDSYTALNYLVENQFFNPHQLVRDERKISLRKEFFKEVFELVPVYLLNTIETPESSLNHVLSIEV
ncbi:MAG: hypothetical protein QXD95_01755 [Nitrososphaeria archaeon]